MTQPPPLKRVERADLVDDVAARLGITRHSAAKAVDLVLDAVIKAAKPRLENDWTGGDVLHTLYRWRGTR